MFFTIVHRQTRLKPKVPYNDVVAAGAAEKQLRGL